MLVREVVRGVVRKPFVVNWAEMTPACIILAKTQSFRTSKQANDFIRKLPYRPGFVRINSAYNLDANLGTLRYCD